MQHSYIEDHSPGSGRLSPRAAFASDLPRIEPDGSWRFRLADGPHDLAEGFEAPDFDDGS